MSDSLIPDDARELDPDRDRYLRELAAQRPRPEPEAGWVAAVDAWVHDIDPADKSAAKLMFGVLVATIGLRIAAGW